MITFWPETGRKVGCRPFHWQPRHQLTQERFLMLPTFKLKFRQQLILGLQGRIFFRIQRDYFFTVKLFTAFFIAFDF